jgi:Helix-turn-helix.
MKFAIKEKREEKKMSQEKLAEMAGISRGTLSRLEQNKDTVTSTTILSRIAEALQCPVASLFVE